MKYKSINRYIPETILNFIDHRIHIFIKWNKDLTSDIYNLDKEGLIIIVDTILRIAGSRDLDKNNFVEINRSSFFKILNNDYTLYLDYLIEENIVICDNTYEAGVKSKGYKINMDYSSDIKSIKMNNNLYLKRTIKAITESDCKLKISTKHKNNFYKDFKIDYESAYNHMIYNFFNKIPDHKGRIMNEYNKMILQRKLMEINDGQLFINRSKTNGRINSNLTILNGDYKKFIIGYDYSLDIVASQPSLVNILVNMVKLIQGKGENQISNPISISSYTNLLSYVYKILLNILGNKDATIVLEKLKTIKIPSQSELEKWKRLTQTGDIYLKLCEDVWCKFGKRVSRKDMKTNFMTIAYSPKNMPNEYKTMFNEIYPTINKLFNDMKSMTNIKRKHKILPIILQCIESYIWVENILSELDKMNIQYHFIHDSVIIKEKDIERVNIKIEEQFYKFNLTPQIKIEKLSNL